MKTHRSLWHVIIRVCGSADGAHSKAPAGEARAWVKRGIVVLALTSGGLGAAVLASPAHSSAVHVHAHATAHQPAGTSPGAGNTLSTYSRPWIF